MKYGLLCLPLLIAFFQLNLLKNSTPLHEDEYAYISRSHFLTLYLDGNFNDSRWQEFESYDMPKFGEYLYAIPFYFRGIFQINDYLENCDFFVDSEDEQEKMSRHLYVTPVNELPENLKLKITPIMWGRSLAVIFSLGAICLFVFIFYLQKKVALGLLASFLLLKQPLFQLTMTRAMGEPPLLFFFLLSLLISIYFILSRLKEPFNWKRDLAYSLVTGLTFGLTTAIKHNGLINFIFFFILLLISLFFTPVKSRFRLQLFPILRIVASVIVVGLLVFILLNPFTWSSPIKNTLFMFRFKIDGMSDLFREFPHLALPTVADKWLEILKQLSSPQGHLNLLGKGVFVTQNLILFFVGLFGALRTLFKSVRKKLNLAETVSNSIYLWSIVFIALTSFWLPVAWERYFMPVVLPVLIIQMKGIEELVFFFQNVVAHYKKELK